MNKGVIIAIIFGVVVIGIIAINSSNFESNDLPIEEAVKEEPTPIEEAVKEEPTPIEEAGAEPQTTGKDLSVELTETVAIRSSP